MITLSVYSKNTMLKSKFMLFLANFCFYSICLLYTLCVLPFGYIIYFFHKLFPHKVHKKYIRIFSYCYGKYFWYVNRVFFPISYTDKDIVKKHSPCIIIANHQSVFDLILFGAQSEGNFVYYVKSWPFKAFFFFAPLMRSAEYINIDAQSQAEVEDKCVKLLQNGTSIIIFPEGKRTRDGKIGKFHSGAYYLACKAKVPVVSIVYENTAQALPVNSKLVYPQKIKISHLPTLYPKDFESYLLPHREMMKVSHKQYVNFLNARSSKC